MPAYTDKDSRGHSYHENDPEQAFSLDNGKYYLSIQEGYMYFDYTIYNSDYSEYDGGQLDEPYIPIRKAVEYVLEAHNLSDLPRTRCDFDDLQYQIEKHDPILATINQDRNTSLDRKIHDAEMQTSKDTSKTAYIKGSPELDI